ncbi:ATP-binding protein [Thermopolyspora sp. NPDC052614]|uniref:AAA family ATPase n=1 Tax=Thermopolyspora sp. NPDC052614 TaxID=3155682 RepID=UPI00343ED025
MLLRFRVANHRSLRDEQTLSFVSTPRRGAPKPRATEIPPAVSVAGIYGANASGKSNVLDALRWMIEAIATSQTRWSPGGGVPRHPFLFAEEYGTLLSFYELDFLYEGVRYSYGFEVDNEAVVGEWLNSFPHGRVRRLFERTGPDKYDFGRTLAGENVRIAKLTRENALYLSSAASNNHPLLRGIHSALVTRNAFIRQGHRHEQARLLATMSLLDDGLVSHYVDPFLQLADLGVEGAVLEEMVLTPEREAQIAAFREAVSRRGESIDADVLRKRITLRRGGTDATLPLDEESDGTRVWLSLIVFAALCLESGNVLVVDEIDSSLHPVLSSTLIRMFKDAEINRNSAQLLFASHDTTLLGSMLEDKILEREEVWFTEKDRDGATELFPLAEFHPRNDENVERGYLQGRYGAVPYVNFEKIRNVFRERRNDLDEPTAQPSTPTAALAEEAGS